MCNSEQHGHGLVRVIWTHLCSGSAATNTFLFCAKECATNSSCGRLALARGGGRRKQINVTTFLRCGLGGGSVRTARFYSSIYQAVQTRWHRSDRPRLPPIVLLKLYPSAVATVSKCVHMHLKQQPMQFLHLVVYECQTFLFFLTSCRYDICIQKNKPCETLGNLPSHVTTNFHISDPADSSS